MTEPEGKTSSTTGRRLYLADIARRLDVTTRTLSRYRVHYPAKGYPCPEPAGYDGRSPYWLDGRSWDWWDAGRPGRGAGGGRPIGS